jgi:hypothetical protein
MNDDQTSADTTTPARTSATAADDTTPTREQTGRSPKDSANLPENQCQTPLDILRMS